MIWKKLIDIITNYKLDMGAGIKRSFYNLFVGVSSNFTIFYIMGGILNWYFLKAGLHAKLSKGFLIIQIVTYSLIFILELRFTFIAPIIFTGLVVVFLAGTYFFSNLPI